MIVPRVAIALAAFPLIAGCVGGLLGDGDPDQLYRLQGQVPGAQSGGAISTPVVAQRTPIVLLPLAFAPEIEGDRMLAGRDREAFYIKDARWVATAPSLVAGALANAFKQRAPALLFTERQGTLGAEYALEVRVVRFEARYPSGADGEGQAAPIAIFAGEARLLGLSDKPVEVRSFSSAVPARENRVSAIVDAHSEGVSTVAAELAEWTQTVIAARPPRSAEDSGGDNNGSRRSDQEH